MVELFKISELPDSFYIDSEVDIIPIVDQSEETTKKCTIEQLSLSATKYHQMYLLDFETNCVVKEGVGYYRIPEAFEGKKLISVEGCCITAGLTGYMTIQIYNVTRALNLLTTQLTIDSGETDSRTSDYSVAINETNNTLFAGNLLRFDITAIHTTAALGLIVMIGMK